MKISLEKEIKSSLENIFRILKDGMKFPVWNPIVKDITAIQSAVEDKIYFLHSDLGTFKIVNFRMIRDEALVWEIEEGIIKTIGFSLIGKENSSVVEIWIKFKDRKLADQLREAADMTLKGLERFAEYLETRGKPENYDKKGLLASVY